MTFIDHFCLAKDELCSIEEMSCTRLSLDTKMGTNTKTSKLKTFLHCNTITFTT